MKSRSQTSSDAAKVSADKSQRVKKKSPNSKEAQKPESDDPELGRIQREIERAEEKFRFSAPRFNVRNVIAGVHHLGDVLTPAEMVAKRSDAHPDALFQFAQNVLADVVASGPEKGADGRTAHLDTMLLLREGIRRLRDFAYAGDTDAMRCLGGLLLTSVADLAELARRKPEIVRVWSSEQNVVPVLTGKNVGHKKRTAEDLDNFAVGEKTTYRVNPPPRKKAPDVSSPANNLAAALCQHLHLHRWSMELMEKPVPEWVTLGAALPDLSQKTATLWVEAAWACLLHATDGRPEADPDLAPFGAKGARKDGLHGPRTVAANVRAAIRTTIKEAIELLAAAPRK